MVVLTGRNQCEKVNIYYEAAKMAVVVDERENTEINHSNKKQGRHV